MGHSWSFISDMPLLLSRGTTWTQTEAEAGASRLFCPREQTNLLLSEFPKMLLTNGPLKRAPPRGGLQEGGFAWAVSMTNVKLLQWRGERRGGGEDCESQCSNAPAGTLKQPRVDLIRSHERFVNLRHLL